MVCFSTVYFLLFLLVLLFSLGGHKSPSNQFKVRWACGAQGSGPTESQLRDAADLAAGTCTVLSCPTDGAYPCPAPDGNDFTPG